MKIVRFAAIAGALLFLVVGGVLPGAIPTGAAAPREVPGLPPGAGGLVLGPYYVVATLDSVTVHNDTDPAGPGEIMIVAGGGSGSLTQTAGFPIALWREASTGDTIPVNLPLAVIASNQMGDDLILTAAVIDNDELPGWFADFLPHGFAAIGAYIGGKLGAALAGKYGAIPGAAIGGYAGSEAGKALAPWLGENELIGTVEVRYTRSGGWGIPTSTGGGNNDVPLAYPCGSYSARGGNATFRYSICRLAAPAMANLRLDVRLDRLIIHANGEGFHGIDLAADVFARVRVTDGISSPSRNRFPASGSMKLKDGDTWDINQTVYFNRTITSPMIFVEVDVWDADKPAAGNDHDMLGIATWKVAVPYLLQPTVVGQSRSHPASLRVRGIDGGEVSVHMTFILTRE